MVRLLTDAIECGETDVVLNILGTKRECPECHGTSLVDYGDGPGSEEPCETCGGSGVVS